MSHLPQRKEKNCLNCGTEVAGRYCQQCGQENLEPKESFWHLITHFFYDFTHFDGKFFSTVKYLILKPGFLSAEYIRGKRASFLHPIRMYIFTSAFFFIIFFWMFRVNKLDFSQGNITGKDSIAWLKLRQIALKDADNHEDSMAIMEEIAKVKSGVSIASIRKKKPDMVRVSLDTMSYKTIAEYDSVQHSLPENERDNWLEKRFKRREIYIAQEHEGDRTAFWTETINYFVHQFPKLFFISLPIFAFILKLLFIRRKQFYYADHAIFTIHLYIFSYILFLIYFCILKLHEQFPSVIWFILEAILWIYWWYYGYKALRNFYKQGRGKTIVKYLLLTFASFVTILILFVIFFSYSVLEA